MRKLILILVSFLIVVSATAQHNVYFLNQSGREILVQKRTVLEKGAFPYKIEIGDTKYQYIPFESGDPAILNVMAVPPKGPYGTADGLYYLLKPGDSLVITLQQNNKPALRHVSNPVRTKELSFIQKHMTFVGKTLPYTVVFTPNALNKKLSDPNLKNRNRLLDSLYRPYINTAESFCKSNGINPEIGRLYKQFYWGSMICDKLFVDRQIDETVKKSIPKFYQDSLVAWSKQGDCEDCNNIPTYKNAIREIYKLRFGHLDELTYLDAVAVQSKGSMREFVLARFMIDRMELTPDAKTLLDRYNKHANNNLYSTVVNEAYTFHAQQSKITPDELATLIRADKSEIGLTKLLNELNGHVIYIDFWASWCGPCVAEFPASHQLKEKIKDHKIVMLYLSVDTDFNSWLKARERHKVNDQFSFILSKPDNNPLIKKINLGPIPRYIIIDKQGDIVRFDATRPSDPETYNTLLEILKKE